MATARFCVVESDGTIRGCYMLDPEIYPAPHGTVYVADPDCKGSPGFTHTKRDGFVPSAEVLAGAPAPEKPSVEDRLTELESKLLALETK